LVRSPEPGRPEFLIARSLKDHARRIAHAHNVYVPCARRGPARALDMLVEHARGAVENASCAAGDPNTNEERYCSASCYVHDAVRRVMHAGAERSSWRVESDGGGGNSGTQSRARSPAGSI